MQSTFARCRAPGMGATPLDGGGVIFRVWAPRARQLAVALCGESTRVFSMSQGADGVYSATVQEARAGSQYYYLVDGDRQRPDPVSCHQPHGVHGPSQVVAHESFAWSDTQWRGLPLEEFVLYELHIGTFTPEGTFDAAITKLPFLQELGITAIELMPVAAFPGTRNWGYDGVSLYAVQDSYGGPDGLKRFVDTCHRHGMACVLDVVYNHLGPEGNYLSEFAPFLTDRYRTPWGDALNFDGPEAAGVRSFFVENALHWLRNYHIDALRLDAIHGIFDGSPRHILDELRSAFAHLAAQLGRRAYLIAESDLNDVRVVSPHETGGYGLDAQWSDDFHHAVHAATLADTHGYFEDFGRLADVARAISHGFIYEGQYSRHRQRPHGTSSRGLSGSRLVICTQNHDQIANGSLGRRTSVLVTFEQQKLLACLLLLSPQLPLLFMGQEFGELAPFHYFVSHSDPGLVEAVRSGRQKEFASFRFAGEFADPQDEATFLACKLDWSAHGRSPHKEMLALHRDLIVLRRGHACLRNCRQDLTRARADAAEQYIVVERSDEAGEHSIALYNFSSTRLRIPIPRQAGTLRLVLASSDPKYGGPAAPDAPPAELSQCGSGEPDVLCPPQGALLYIGGGDS